MTSAQSIAAREKRAIALTSVGAAVFLTLMKLTVGLETNSLGILSEAAHSGLDLVAAVMTYAAVRIADRPPDRDHPYGHGKIENLSAFIETLLLVITCGWIVYEALQRLLVREPHIESSVWSFAVIGISIIIDISRSRALSRVAKKHNSQALEADALHFSSDIWSSLVVLIGLVFVGAGLAWVDALAAVLVALLVLFVSYRLGRRTIDALMDKVPDGLYEKVQGAVAEIDGVEEIRAIRLRPSGGSVFIDMTIGIRRTTPFHEAHGIMDRVERAIHERIPHADVIVHAEPFAGDDESVADKIRMAVVRRGLPVPHNLEIHHVGGGLHVDFDVECKPDRSFVEAHAVASELEDDIRREIPSIDRLTIHLEEEKPEQSMVVERPGPEDPLKVRIEETIMQDKRILGMAGFSLLRTGSKYNLSVDCLFDSSRTLVEVHDIISETETRLHQTFPQLRRVVVHAEPG